MPTHSLHTDFSRSVSTIVAKELGHIKYVDFRQIVRLSLDKTGVSHSALFTRTQNKLNTNQIVQELTNIMK